ncbi:serine/threonine-protein kinase [Piscinibacter gummiphilus]|uniref:Serine/threonine-protein kinase n=1 Tax=Piscinibacter gummiphilus TaxID=946333 RepID=A0ABZ0CQ42_9BURK|nr:serine/threonine-protein kinase [Piscinibacter gummiphilus]WOB07085.1 serine/threonine-protein kinase [Piscinibacter gummiphilus]
MTGPDSEPLPSVPSNPQLPPDSAPWVDTEEMSVDFPAATPQVTRTVTPAANGKGQDMATIGHIGRYALKYQIGEGGLGRVFAAHDPLLSRLIAIKTLNLEIAAEEREAFNALFLNEARAAGGLSHPHIVTVFDAGVSDQGAYIAMELLKGRDLRQLRLEGWKPTPTQAALIVRRVSDALAYAHSKGVVHRDIKPANIFMVGRTQPRVLDFGIARVAHQHENEGDIAGGSPYYMSPEQVQHAAVDRRTDVFSLGVVLYELLTGTRPFRGNSLQEITGAVVSLVPPKAHEVDASVPRALSEITAKAMEKNPDDRYRSARALSRELRHWLEEHAQQESQEAAEEGLAGGKKPVVWALAAVGALAVAATAWWALSSRGPAPDTAHEMAQAAAPVVAQVVTAPPAAAPEVASAPAPVVDNASPAVDPAASAAPTASLPAPAPAAAPVAPTPAPAPVQVAQVDKTEPAPAKAAAAKKETPKERRVREAREREARRASGAVAATGTLRIAVSPWGNVEVDGKPVGTTPPLNELTLSEGRHTITIRNDEFPPFSASVTIVPGQPVSLKHRFGS